MCVGKGGVRGHDVAGHCKRYMEMKQFWEISRRGERERERGEGKRRKFKVDTHIG